MRFLVDTQLPAALACWLRDKGHQAEHVLEVGLAQSKDNSVWHYAGQHGAAIVTKDEDFAGAVPGPQLYGCASAIHRSAFY